MGWENGSLVETVDFDYDSIDGREVPTESVDETFWRNQGELLGEILRWLTVPKTLAGMGQRVATLALYLNPELIDQKALTDIEKLDGAPVSGAALSKALLTFQAKHGAHRGYFQKAAYLSDTYSRSATVVHEQRREKLNGNGKHPQHNEEYLKRQVADLERQLQETKDNSICSIKERASKGGKSHKGTAFAARRAKKAAKARWRKPR